MDFRKFRGTDRYLTSSALESAVNCALALERPLLVRGEPGTGKTQLAEAIAAGLGMRLIHWPVKSTTRAQDGLYVYDTVQRLYDSRFGEGDVKDIRRYIKYGPLGQAFAAPERCSSTKSTKPTWSFPTTSSTSSTACASSWARPATRSSRSSARSW
jgi:MoxR-like ATPase